MIPSMVKSSKTLALFFGKSNYFYGQNIAWRPLYDNFGDFFCFGARCRKVVAAYFILSASFFARVYHSGYVPSVDKYKKSKLCRA